LFVGTGPTTEKGSSRTKSLKRKLWEWNASWLGLALSLAIAFFITDASKNLFGKPRPDLLARCDPDLSRTLSSVVGGIGAQVDEGINLVSWTICRKPGSTLDDGFRSFPSGHSSCKLLRLRPPLYNRLIISAVSFAGMTYLALFLCAKLAIAIPFLNYHSLSGNAQPATTPPRRQAAAPPTYLLIFPLVPICIAIYVSSTRYSDFRHHGFDIISGAILGIASAWLGFHWYHMPIRRGGGWAWAPRSPERAFARGIGVLSYANNQSTSHHGLDLETGRRHVGSGADIRAGQDRQHKTSDGSEGIPLDDLNDSGPYRESDSSRRPLR